MNAETTKLNFKQNAVCLVIPTYNNGRTVTDVVRNALEYCEDIIVVNDGSTDDTAKVLETLTIVTPPAETQAVETHGRTSLHTNITVITHPINKGKGKALTTGFQTAMERGFRYAITMDADGQHYASDLPAFSEALANHSETLIVGSRQFGLPNMPQKSSFANKFSNFWFTVQTGKKLPDTQTGYRLYPLNKMGQMKLLSSRYEAELALLVRSAWRGINILPIPINVYYPPKEERVSHFRPGMDFFRISVLNTFFIFAAILYGYPAMLYHHIKFKIQSSKFKDRHT
jgi:glycosyltransferase involved in cell wall biosynthesis